MDLFQKYLITQSAGVVEYVDGILAEMWDLSH